MRRNSLNLAAMLAVAAFSSMASAPQQVPDAITQREAPRAIAPKRITPASREAWGKKHGRCGPGWSPRQVQRMAKKRRNQQRNKRANRGGR